MFTNKILKNIFIIKCFVKNKFKKTNRDLLQLKHFLFRKRLESKCLLTKTTIDICTEEYTSQTCGRCGQINKIGTKDVYICNYCELIIDRDVNGARNIAIKRISEI